MKISELKLNGKYLAIPIPAGDRDKLLATFPALYSKVIAHHITVAFNPHDMKPDKLKHWLEMPHDVTFIGTAFDDSIQAAIVEVDGNKGRPMGGSFHVTISHEANRKPVDSNALLHDPSRKTTTLVEPLRFTDLKAELLQK